MRDSPAAIIAVTRSEPVDRLRRMLAGCAAQTVGCRVYVAAPAADAATIRAAAHGLTLDVTHVENPGGARSQGLNRAVRAADRPIVCRLDARTQPPNDYVERCISVLGDPAVGMVGGVQRPVPASRTRRGRAIARALANPYVVGAAPYRVGARSGPVDTVYLGAFRREQLLEIGGYAEDLEANEDFDLATRYRARGLMVWLDADMVHAYEARKTIGSVVEQYFAFGRAKAVYWRHTSERPNARQTAAIAAVSAGLPLVAVSRRRGPLSVGAVASLACLDHVVGEPGETVSVRALAVAVEAGLPMVWVAGIYREVLHSALAERRHAGTAASSSR